MLSIKKKLLSLALVILSAGMVFIACAKDVYKNLKLELSVYSHTLTLSDTDADNFFDIVATVTGRPKKYDGSVTFDFTSPTSSLILESKSDVSNGQTTASFKAIAPGFATIIVKTKENNLEKRVNVNVVKEITGLTFNSSVMTMARGSSESLQKMLVFTPSNTSQKEVTYQIALTDESQNAEDLQKIYVNNAGELVVPQNTTVQNIIVTATSVANGEITSNIQVNIVEGILPNDIRLFDNNKTQNQTDDDILLQKDGDVFLLELAKNVTEYSLKEIYFNFKNGQIESDLFSVTVKSFSNFLEVNKISGLLNTFAINSLSEGEGLVVFEVKQIGYENNANLTRLVTLRVKSVSYPKQIVLTDGQSSSTINEITVYDNYQGRRGAPIYITVKDDMGLMKNQYVYASFNKTMSGKVRVESASGEIITETTKILTGSTIYVYHTYVTNETSPDDLILEFTSETYSEIKSSVFINFVRGQINIGVENPNLKIDKSKDLGEGKEFGYTQVVLNGLVSGFDFTTLTVVVDNPSLVTVVKEQGELGFAGTGLTGQTRATITAPNGSSVVVNITIFEALVAEETKLIFAGREFLPVSADISIDDLKSLYHISLRNNTTLDFSFIVNGTSHIELPEDITPFTDTNDLQGNIVSSSSSVIRVISYKRLQTQSLIGSSVVTFGMTGYNEDGIKNKEVIFKFIVDVKIPISDIKTTQNIVNIYDQNTLGSTQITEYGSYSVRLETLPARTQYKFNELEWKLEYLGQVYTPTSTDESLSGDITYTFTIGGIIPSYVTLKTNRYNYSSATVSVRLNAFATANEKFNILAIITQNYGGDLGQNVEVRRELKVMFTVIKAKKVNNIVFNNIHNNTVTFDSRDLEYANGRFNASISERTYNVSFSTFPFDALTSSLAVINNSSAITATVDNDLKIIKIIANSKIADSKAIELIVYTKDSENANGSYGRFVVIRVEILDGSSEELAYKINTAQDLIKINSDMSAYYVLTNNINLAGISSWSPVGVKTVNGLPSLQEFNGHLNGRYNIGGTDFDYQINGLTYQNLSNEFNHNYVGLFGSIGINGVVKNITFNNVKINVTDNGANRLNFTYIGVVAGLNNGTIENVSVNDGNGLTDTSGQALFMNKIESINNPNTNDSLAVIASGIKYSSISNDLRLIAIGGIVGFNNSNLLNNSSYATINFNDVAGVGSVYAGGIAGINFGENAVITKDIDNNYVSSSSAFDVVAFINIANELSVLNAKSSIGGISGFNNAIIENQNVRTVVIKGFNNVGGIVGHNAGNNKNTSLLKNNLTVPTIRGNEFVGGAIGYSVENNYELEQDIKDSSQNYRGLRLRGEQTSEVIITDNKVEFIDYKYNYSLYNTAIIAKNFAGGFVGSYTTEGVTNGFEFNFKNILSFNAVNSFYSNRVIENYYNTAMNQYNNSYFGDIVLGKAVSDDIAVYAGGIAGRVTHAYIASNHFNGNIQGSNAIIGGAVGLVDNVDANDNFDKQVTIINTNIEGYIVNSQGAGSVVSSEGTFFGESLNMFSNFNPNIYSIKTKNYNQGLKTDYFNVLSSKANIKNKNNNYITNITGTQTQNVTNMFTYIIGQTDLVAYVAWTNRVVTGTTDLPVYNYTKFVMPEITESMIQNGFSSVVYYDINEDVIEYDEASRPRFTIALDNLYEVNNARLQNFSLVFHKGNEFDPTGFYLDLPNTTGHVIFSTNEILNTDAYDNSQNAGSYNRNEYNYNEFLTNSENNSIKRYNLVSDINDNGILDAHDDDIVNLLNALGENYFLVANDSELSINEKISVINSIISGVLDEELLSPYWFNNKELRNDEIVNLSQNKVYIDVSVQNDVIVYNYGIRLLSNWPPTSISVSVKPNYDTVYEAVNILGGSDVVLTHNQISREHFVNPYLLNLSGYNLTTSQQEEISFDILNKLKDSNTHDINSVINLRTVPGFVGVQNLKIESNNNSLLGVEVINGKTVFVTKGVGAVNVKITSTTNPDVTKTFKINLVARINDFDKHNQTGLVLQKQQGDSLTDLNRVDSLEIIKNNDKNIKAVSLKQKQQNIFNYSNTLTGSINFNAPENNASGIRYYLLNEITFASNINYQSIYRNTEAQINLLVNNKQFTSQLLSNGKYVHYIDIDANSPAVLSSDVIGEFDLLAVPYYLTQDGQKALLINQTVLGDLGLVSYQENGNYVLFEDFNFVNQIKVKSINGTWGLTSDVSSVGFEPISELEFTVSVLTDDVNEKLFVSYNEDGQKVTYLVDDINDIVNNGNSASGYRKFKVGIITIEVNYLFTNGKKDYNFTVTVSESDRFNTESKEALSKEILTKLNFMVLNNYNLEFDNYDLNKVTDTAMSVAYTRELTINVVPQNVKNIIVNHYPSGEYKVENGVGFINLEEVAYDTIVPGFAGILKVNVIPYFTNFDHIIIEGIVENGVTMSLEQMLAEYSVADNNYTGVYTGVYPYAEIVGNGIKLTKQSFKDLSGAVSYDGMFYIRTLISSSLINTPIVKIVIKGYKNNSVVFESEKVLTVITPPGLNLNYNGQKTAAHAMGTSLEFKAEKLGVVGNIDFSGSERITRNGVKLKTGFSIRAVAGKADTYLLTTSTDLLNGDRIVIKGYIEKEINGVIYPMEDTLEFMVSEFVIENIRVQNVINGKFQGLYNQLYDLAIIIDATYNRAIAGVEDSIRDLERQLSTLPNGNASDNFIWFEQTKQGTETINEPFNSLGYSKNRSYILSAGGLSGRYEGLTGFKMRNIIFNSPEVLGAEINYSYTENGVKILNKNNPSHLNEMGKPFSFFKETTFTFDFYRVSTEDSPDPIRTVSELKEMQAGKNYILINDLELNNWVPLNTEIASLDGNGYVLRINSFKLPEESANSADMIDVGNIGLFGTVSSATTLKNITIEVPPSANLTLSQEAGYIENDTDLRRVDLDINAKNYLNVNFGFVAGVNNGIITNANVVYDASMLKLERELKVALYDSSDIDYEKYYVSGKFDYNRFLSDNFAKFFPRKTISSSDLLNLYDTTTNSINFDLIKDSASQRRDISLIRVLLRKVETSQTFNISGLVARNTGFITNSSVENITIIGEGNVAGLVVNNSNKISSSFFKGANIINRSSRSLNAATAGLVVTNTGSIQYSYVMGREGDGNNYTYALKDLVYEKDATNDEVLDINKSGKILTPNDNSDKTGLSDEIKAKFAGSGYNKYKDVIDGYKYDFDFRMGALRAMNSAILSNPQAAGFVYNNAGTISNSYSNILVSTSSAGSSGFVYTNSNIINDVYSLSSVQLNSLSHSPFTGTDNDQRILNTGKISFASYLQASVNITGEKGNLTNTVNYTEEYKVVNEVANAINLLEFSDYNSFQGFAFNSDYSQNKEIQRSVWFMPNGNELTGNKDSIKEYFKNNQIGYHSAYVQNRPELVSANLRTISIRRLSSNINDQINKYDYVSSDIIEGTSVKNPILIRTAEEFNSYVTDRVSTKSNSTTYANEPGVIKEQHNAIRFISDIRFNNQDMRANTYMIDYLGDLEGNGMTIKSLRLVSDSDVETEDVDMDNLRRLGLFGSIKSSVVTVGTGPNATQKVVRGIVRNINIEVGEVRGTNVTYVGVLAGVIENASVYNISIDGQDIVQGRNVVGGLAGLVTGDSEMVNISVNGIGANATYYYQNQNPFRATDNALSPQRIGKFTLFNSQNAGVRQIINENNLSYVGGIAGILDVNEIDANSDSSLRTARARKLKVTGNVSLVGEVVGGVLGGVSSTSIANDIEFEVSRDARIKATRVAGGLVGDNRGTIDRAQIKNTESIQEQIDKEIQKQTLTATTNKISNSSLNANNLYATGNPIYMGGIVGINIGGHIINSYNKVNVNSINAMYGGGIAGLSIGGGFERVYTTASASAFKVVGGAIALQVQNDFLTPQYINVGQNKGSYIFNAITNAYEFVGSGKGDFKKEPALKQQLTVGNHLVYIDYVNSQLDSPDSTTIINSVVASNIWKQEDVAVLARGTMYNSKPTTMGAFIGELLINSQTSTSFGSRYLLSDAIKTDGVNSTANRKKNENNYFNQVFLNADFGGLPKLNGKTNFDLLMPEIGTVNQNSTNALILGRDLSENDIRVKNGIVNNTGTTDNYEVSLNDAGTRKRSYHYSRLQNVGSSRTIKEIVSRIYILDQGLMFADSTNTPINDSNQGGIEITASIPVIYNKWPVNYWKGTGIRKSEETSGYILDEPEFIFPQVSPIADLSVVYVSDPSDLALMHIYKNATYILLNDIDLLDYAEEWVPAGTADSPFRGRIMSQTSTPVTIRGLNIESTPEEAYLGLVGYTQKSEFKNFNLELENIDLTANTANTEEYHIGTLFGFGEDVSISDVHVTSNNNTRLASYNISSIGGIAGTALRTSVKNVSVSDIDLRAYGIFESPTGGNTYVGGAFGRLTNDNASVSIDNVNVYDTDVTVLDESVNIKATHNGGGIFVGGVFGQVSGNSTFTTKIQGINYIGHNNKVSVNVNYLQASHTGSSKLENVAVGGIAGVAESVTISEIINDTNVINSNVESLEINLTTKHYNNEVMIGGAFGRFNSIIVNTQVYDSYNVSDLKLKDVNIKYLQGERAYTGQSSSTIRDVMIGGVFGSLNSTRNINIESNTAINIDNNHTGSTHLGNISVGGLGGVSTENAGDKDIYITNNLVVNNNSRLMQNADGNFGGLYGSVVSVNHSTNDNNALIFNYGASNIAVDGEIKVNRLKDFNIGGVYGKSVGIYTNKVISNTDLIVTGSLYGDIVNMGGVVGVINGTNNQISYNSEFKNTYSTGHLITDATTSYSENGIIKGMGTISGIAGRVNVNEGQPRVSFDSVYSISKQQLNSANTALEITSKVSDVNRGGIIGALNAGLGYEKSSSEKLKIVNAYYAVEGVDSVSPYGKALSYADMLNANNPKFVGFNSTDWQIVNNTFPMLKSDSNQNAFDKVQAKGSQQNPITVSTVTQLENNKAYLVNIDTASFIQNSSDLIGNSIYFVNAPIRGDIGTIDAKSAIINAKSSVEISIFSNNGKILGFDGPLKLYMNNGLVQNAVNDLNITNHNSTGIISKSNKVKILGVSNGQIAESILIGTNSNHMYDSHFVIENDGINTATFFNEVGSQAIIKKEVNSIYTNKNTDINKLDLVNKFILINALTNNTSDNNYGYPILKRLLKNNWYDSDIVKTHKWDNYSDADFGRYDVQNNNLSGEVLKININTDIEINTASDFAKLSFMTSVGVTESVIVSNHEFGNNLVTVTPINSFLNRVVVTSYEYGIKTVTTKVLANYAGKNIKVNADINLGGKVFTPIGYGINLNDNGLLSSNTNKDYNAFKGVVYGQGHSVYNASVVSNENSGLFGLVEVSRIGQANQLNLASLFNSLYIKDSLVASDKHNNQSVSGLLAGRVYVNQVTSLSRNTIANGISGDKSIILSGGFASGLIGKVFKNTNAITNDNAIAIVRSYSNSIVGSDTNIGQANGIVGNNTNLSIDFSEVYSAGTILGSSRYAITREPATFNKGDVFSGLYTLHNLNSSESSVEKISDIDLRYKHLSGLNWASEHGWVRAWGYPVFGFNVIHSFDNVTAVSEVDNTYIINTPQELAWVSKQTANGVTFAGKTVRLARNISLEEFHWNPIGNKDTAFMGKFDGAGFNISEIMSYGHYRRDNAGNLVDFDKSNIGLFGVVENAEIYNLNIRMLNIVDANNMVIGIDNVGLLVGHAKGNTLISNISLSGAFVYGVNYVGGVVGRIDGGKINNMLAMNQDRDTIKDLVVNGQKDIGGVAGYSNAVIEFATVKDTVVSSETAGVKNLGGIVGRSANLINFVSFELGSRVLVSQTAVSNVAHIVGNLEGANSGLRNAQNLATVNLSSQGTNIGSLVGYGFNINTNDQRVSMAIDNSFSSLPLIGSAGSLVLGTVGTPSSVTSGSFKIHDNIIVDVKDMFNYSSVWNNYRLQLKYLGNAHNTETGYYSISNEEDLRFVKWLTERDYKERLFNSYTITSSFSTSIKGIGNKINPFYSELNGSNSKITLTGAGNSEFISYLGYSQGSALRVNISNLTIELSQNYNLTATSGNEGLSPFIANANYAQLTNVAVVPTQSNSFTISGGSYLGGLIGFGTDIEVINSRVGNESINNKFNFMQNESSRSMGGLVGYVTGNSVIRSSTNINLYNTFNASGNYGNKDRVGGIVGEINGVSITINGYINRGIVRGSQHVGGLIGYAWLTGQASLSNLHNAGAITGGRNIGGIAGYMYNGKLLSATGSRITNSGTITVTSSTLTFITTSDKIAIGGLFGYIYHKDNYAVSYLENTGLIDGTYGSQNIGGLFGTSYGGQISLQNIISSGNILIPSSSRSIDTFISKSFYDWGARNDHWRLRGFLELWDVSATHTYHNITPNTSSSQSIQTPSGTDFYFGVIAGSGSVSSLSGLNTLTAKITDINITWYTTNVKYVHRWIGGTIFLYDYYLHNDLSSSVANNMTVNPNFGGRGVEMVFTPTINTTWNNSTNEIYALAGGIIETTNRRTELITAFNVTRYKRSDTAYA